MSSFSWGSKLSVNILWFIYSTHLPVLKFHKSFSKYKTKRKKWMYQDYLFLGLGFLKLDQGKRWRFNGPCELIVLNPDLSLMGGFQMIMCSRISTILEIQLGKMLHSYKKIAANQGALYDSKKRDEVRKRLRRILLSNISYGP